MNLLLISHRQQSQQADCLAACTAMLLEYLHVPVQYENLLRLLNVRSFGASLSNLRNLQKLGLSVVIEEGQFSALRKSPYIPHASAVGYKGLGEARRQRRREL